MSTPQTIVITGAAGFIGRHTVAAARTGGHRVRALVRRDGAAPLEWRSDPMIETIVADLSGDGAIAVLGRALDGADTIIHASAAMAGGDAHHARETVRPLANVIAAIADRQNTPPRLVLVSSISVYDTRALPPFSVLDETCPLEGDGQARDAYCRSKLAQERLALEAADRHALDVIIMRPGAVFGPNRLWNGHLGPTIGPAVLLIETRGEVPVNYVAHCAQAVILASERPLTCDDRPAGSGQGRVEIINVLDTDRPTRAAYIAALKSYGGPKMVIGGFRYPLSVAASMLEAVPYSYRLPGLLRPATLDARTKPLVYSNARLRERLGWIPTHTFEAALREAWTNSTHGDGHPA